MTPTEAGQLLIAAGKVSGHTAAPDVERVQAWAAVLAHVPYADAMKALSAHFADPEVGAQYLMPAHITRQLAKRRTAAALKPLAIAYCPVPGHGDYPVLPVTGCDMCTRYPEDAQLAAAPPTRHLGELKQLTVGRTIPEGDAE
ncbi:hypothetical protein EOG37_01320 [Clavibacter michiganensis subsp. michiganensis]|uniref:hypothetical protein n=1 Tax=Clavibacter michiganensis TaxID=28447 RepID=UPI001C64EB6F|nr:hypothetical protein [Clavibacter michiganensis]MBW8025320.1 hypothetical protein [Clavibacter michiganensis subsp. michiganensis]